MTYSVVFALPPQLRTMLTADSALTALDVHVTTGPRRTPAGAKELAVQEMRAPASRPITGGIRREKGSFVLRAYCEAAGAGEDSIDAARADASAILEAASDVLEADPTIGDIVRFCDVVEVVEDDQSISEQPSLHTFTAHIQIGRASCWERV